MLFRVIESNFSNSEKYGSGTLYHSWTGRNILCQNNPILIQGKCLVGSGKDIQINHKKIHISNCWQPNLVRNLYEQVACEEIFQIPWPKTYVIRTRQFWPSTHV